MNDRVFDSNEVCEYQYSFNDDYTSSFNEKKTIILHIAAVCPTRSPCHVLYAMGMTSAIAQPYFCSLTPLPL